MLEATDLNLFQTISIVALVTFAGFVDSIAGGGGLISLPTYFAFGLPPHAALATNKFSSFMGTCTAVIRYHMAGKIKLKIGFSAAIGALFGSAIGAKLALFASEDSINLAMLILVPAVLVFFMLKDKIKPGKESGKTEQHQIFKSAMIGILIGCYDGFIGPGTGTFMAISFNAFLGMDLVKSAGNARLANTASNAGALIVFLINGQVFFPLAFYAAAGGIAGNYVGSRLAIKKGEKIVRPLMILVLLLLLAEVVREQFFAL